MIKQDTIQNLFLRPVVPLLFSLISGIIICDFFPGNNGYALLLFIGAGIAIPVKFYRKTDLKLPALFLFASLGYISLHPYISADLPPNHIYYFTGSGKVNIQGRIFEKPVQKGFRRTFYLHTEIVEKDGEQHIASGKLRVSSGGGFPLISNGDTVKVVGSIRPIRNFNNPGGFDYKRHMALKGVHASVYTRASDIRVIKQAANQRAVKHLSMFRQNISALIESTIEKEHKYVLKALLIGEKTDIPKTLREDFNRAGAAHLLAISGLHIGIIASLSFFLLKSFFSRIHLFLWNAWASKIAAVVTCIPVLLYGMLSGMSPSTQRAVIMVVIFLLTFLFEEKHDVLNTLALAAFVILLFSPASLFSVSFQLSFTAVFFIIYAFSKLIKKEIQPEGMLSKLVRKTTLFFFVSLFAITGTLPLVAFYFNQISFAGLVSNVVFIPLIGFLVVPIGLLSVAIFPIHMPAAGFGIKACGTLLEKTIVLIKYISGIPCSAFKTVSPSCFEIICIYILLIALINTKKQSPGSTHKNARITAIVIIFILVIDTGYWINKRFFNPDLKITVLDVGQGSAALVEFPGSRRMLIDGGGFSDNNVFNVGKRILAPFLWRNKIRTIDTLVLSHPNCDHLNGLIYIAKHFHVNTVLSNNEASTSKAYQHFLDTIHIKDIHMPLFEHIKRSGRINNVEMSILYPPDTFIRKKTADSWRNSNNNSLVVRLSFGSVSILFPGDIMEDAERELVNLSGSGLKSSVILAPHHGSRTSSSEKFLRIVDPDVAVFSSGWNNRYHMPHPEVLERYKNMGCRIFRTDRHGAISIRTDGTRLEVTPTVQTE